MKAPPNDRATRGLDERVDTKAGKRYRARNDSCRDGNNALQYVPRDGGRSEGATPFSRRLLRDSDFSFDVGTSLSPAALFATKPAGDAGRTNGNESPPRP